MVRVISVLLWVLTLAAACLGGLVLGMGVLTSQGAPQEAAAAGIACGLGVLPYVAARAWDESTGVNRPE